MSVNPAQTSTFRTFRPWLITAAVLVAVVLLVQYLAGAMSGQPKHGEGRGDHRMPGNAPAGFMVSAAKVEQADLAVHYSALGTVTAFSTVNVRSRVDGELVKVLFEEGQEVKAGDLLAVIDPRQYRVALEQAEGTLQQNRAQLKNAELDVQRYRGLYAEDSIAKQTLDTQEALVDQYRGVLKANQAAVDDAKLNLQFTEVRAPISGRLGLRQVDTGNLISAGDTTGLVVITQVKPIAVIFSLPEQQLPTIRRQLASGEPLKVEALDRNQNQLLAEGVVTTLDNQIDITTGTVKLKARFENADAALFPNQFVNVRLRAETLHEALLVPANAVQRGSQGSFVYVLDAENKVSLRTVSLGTAEGERVQILEGLKAGERVVTEGVDRLREGMTVKVAGEAEPEASLASPEQREGRAGAGA